VLNPLANLVYSARGGADTVICNGRILMENGTVLSIDEKRAFAEAKQRGERIATDSGLWDLIKPKWPVF
jgi:cytosine/adenosine deaminase-related metal-dependent hydrolase